MPLKLQRSLLCRAGTHPPIEPAQGSFTHDDGTSNSLAGYLATAQDNTADWVLGTKVWTHTYATPVKADGNPYRVSYSSCCRLSNLANGRSE